MQSSMIFPDRLSEFNCVLPSVALRQISPMTCIRSRRQKAVQPDVDRAALDPTHIASGSYAFGEFLEFASVAQCTNWVCLGDDKPQ
jgi:hypothetical protein